MDIVDHNTGGLMGLVDRVVVLNNGNKIAAGPPDEIDETEAVQEAYLVEERLQ